MPRCRTWCRAAPPSPRSSREEPGENCEQRHHEHEPAEHEEVDPAPGAEAGHTRLIVRWWVGRRARHWPRETRLAKSRYAPGTPSGSWRNHERLVYTR